MIHHKTILSMYETHEWLAVAAALKDGIDTFIFVATTGQLFDFREKLKKYDLEKYVVARSDGEGQGTTNRWYETPQKLKVFILQGKKDA